eukprot:1873848-Rhodomonas_salina.1
MSVPGIAYRARSSIGGRYLPTPSQPPAPPPQGDVVCIPPTMRTTPKHAPTKTARIWAIQGKSRAKKENTT